LPKNFANKNEKVRKRSLFTGYHGNTLAEMRHFCTVEEEEFIYHK